MYLKGIHAKIEST
jgi:hypothetical protein